MILLRIFFYPYYWMFGLPSDSNRKHNCFGIVMRILSTVMLFIVVMAFVWVPSGRITAQSSVHHTSGDRPVAGNHDLMSVSNPTHVVREEERVWNATLVSIQESAGEQSLSNGPRAQHSRVTALSRNDGVVFHEQQFETGQLVSKNRAPMFVIQGKLMKKMPHSVYHHRGNTSTVVDENLTNETDTSQVLHKINIRLNHRQINNNSYPTILRDETVDDDTDILNNNQNAYDLNYDLNDKGSEKNKNSIDRSGWTRFFNRSGQNIPGGLWLLKTPEISGSSDQFPYRLGAHYQNEKDMKHMFEQYDANRNPNILERQLLKHIPPSYKINFKTRPILDTRQDSSILQPPESISAVQNNISRTSQPNEVPITYEVTWRKIGLMALIKLGLVKLKVIGFIKFLYFLLFKLKFVLIVLFLKFFSILKFIKFSSLPLFLLSLAAIIFLVIMNNPNILSTSNTPILNNEGAINSPGETISVPSGQTQTIVAPPVQTQPVVATQVQTQPAVATLLPAQPAVDPPVQTQPAIAPPAQTQPAVAPPVQTQPAANRPVQPQGIPPDVIQAFNNVGLRFEPIEVMDPTLGLFQKELNSEKCVERIACKIAANGKTGIIPLWINWVLHRVSKPVPNDKLLYYLKAYDDVINEIYMKSPNPDNWETWCFERYNCNNTDTQ